MNVILENNRNATCLLDSKHNQCLRICSMFMNNNKYNNITFSLFPSVCNQVVVNYDIIDF